MRRRELTGAAFGAFFYNVVDDRGETYTLYTLSGVPREAFDQVPDAAQHRGVRADLQRRGHRALGRHHAGSALRQERALSRHAQGPSAGAQLSRGAGDLAHRRGAGRAVLRSSQPGVFDERAERVVAAIAAQAAIAIDKARCTDAAQRRDRAPAAQAEEALRQSEQSLESKVSVRTAELRRPMRG